MNDYNDPEFDNLLRDFESAIRRAPIPFPYKSFIVEYDLAKIALQKYVGDALAKERERKNQSDLKDDE